MKVDNVYRIKIMSALQIKNTRESDPHSYEVKQLQIKPRKNSEASTGFKPMTFVIPV